MDIQAEWKLLDPYHQQLIKDLYVLQFIEPVKGAIDRLRQHKYVHQGLLRKVFAQYVPSQHASSWVVVIVFAHGSLETSTTSKHILPALKRLIADAESLSHPGCSLPINFPSSAAEQKFDKLYCELCDHTTVLQVGCKFIRQDFLLYVVCLLATSLPEETAFVVCRLQESIKLRKESLYFAKLLADGEAFRKLTAAVLCDCGVGDPKEFIDRLVSLVVPDTCEPCAPRSVSGGPNRSNSPHTASNRPSVSSEEPERAFMFDERSVLHHQGALDQLRQMIPESLRRRQPCPRQSEAGVSDDAYFERRRQQSPEPQDQDELALVGEPLNAATT